MINTINKIKMCCLTIGQIPTSYLNSLSYEEQLLWLCKKLNDDVIPNLNKLITEFNDLDINFDEINEKINALQIGLSNLRNELSQTEARIDAKVSLELQNQYNQVIQLMNDYQSIFNNNLQNLRTDLENEIERIELGDVKAYDPTTGEYSNISSVILNIYDALRNNSITVSEFEALELTATEYDDKEITAYNFDVNGKTFLNV